MRELLGGSNWSVIDSRLVPYGNSMMLCCRNQSEPSLGVKHCIRVMRPNRSQFAEFYRSIFHLSSPSVAARTAPAPSSYGVQAPPASFFCAVGEERNRVARFQQTLETAHDGRPAVVDSPERARILVHVLRQQVLVNHP